MGSKKMKVRVQVKKKSTVKVSSKRVYRVIFNDLKVIRGQIFKKKLWCQKLSCIGPLNFNIILNMYVCLKCSTSSIWVCYVFELIFGKSEFKKIFWGLRIEDDDNSGMMLATGWKANKLQFQFSFIMLHRMQYTRSPLLPLNETGGVCSSYVLFFSHCFSFITFIYHVHPFFNPTLLVQFSSVMLHSSANCFVHLITAGLYC